MHPRSQNRGDTANLKVVQTRCSARHGPAPRNLPVRSPRAHLSDAVLCPDLLSGTDRSWITTNVLGASNPQPATYNRQTLSCHAPGLRQIGRREEPWRIRLPLSAGLTSLANMHVTYMKAVAAYLLSTCISPRVRFVALSHKLEQFVRA
nr:hypothetical protein CFP56_52499 [Quercus suber]